jgi:hypothetical protein
MSFSTFRIGILALLACCSITNIALKAQTLTFVQNNINRGFADVNVLPGHSYGVDLGDLPLHLSLHSTIYAIAAASITLVICAVAARIILVDVPKPKKV